ncbi:hypothetical protein F5B22DRAFT_641364 [Xylaria bambusicola]|uniref:uncharacterized protein n=1 Tax=Xylaria bambusicola TaxID=326684 RepID=UPI002007618A|nr:uncharacterized protein F5B22DRAFT_641364 [Xylaria bambusicola]KAI0526216.1 hypothetical protein F5B22DRAFT_641364 [Xylaria bambusicola]
MQRTPPLNLPSRPSLAVNVYTTLPDASKAGLPPKPPITPNSPTSTKFSIPRLVLTPSPSPESKSKKTHRGQKRTYSYSSDAIIVPLPATPIPDRARNSYLNGHKYDETNRHEHMEYPVKVRRTSLTATSVHTNNSNHRHQPGVKPIHHEARYISKLEEEQLKLRLIHNKLLGGATTLTVREQDYLRRQMNSDTMRISPLVMHLIIQQVANKTHELSNEIMNWSQKRHESQLLEDVLTDRLYNFDVEAAFDEGLMSPREVSDLVDCQIMLEYIRMGQPQEIKAECDDIRTDSDEDESDTGSQEMDFSDDSD